MKNVGIEKVNIIGADFSMGTEVGFLYIEEESVGLLVFGEKRFVKVIFIQAMVGSYTMRIIFDT